MEPKNVRVWDGKSFTAAQPEGEAALRNPHTGQLRDYRDVESDPAGILCTESGAPLMAALKPEGEATLFQQMAKATIQSQAQFFLQKARAEKAEAETDDVRIAAREEITVLVARAEKAEAELASVRAALAYTERQNGELETALAELHAQPAPQAGDAPAAIGEVVAGGRFVSNIEWFAGYMPPVGTKLYAAPPASAAQQVAK